MTAEEREEERKRAQLQVRINWFVIGSITTSLLNVIGRSFTS